MIHKLHAPGESPRSRPLVAHAVLPVEDARMIVSEWMAFFGQWPAGVADDPNWARDWLVRHGAKVVKHE